MRKVGGALLGLLLLSGCGISAATQPPVVPQIVETQTTTKPATQPLKVYGPDSEQVRNAILYWNLLADKTLFSYTGAQPQVWDNKTVMIEVTDPGDGFDGLASGHVGHTWTSIKVRPTVTDWGVYAHELGHALGLEDYNTGQAGVGIVDPSYRGIMSYEHFQNPVWQDDEDLLLTAP